MGREGFAVRKEILIIMLISLEARVSRLANISPRNFFFFFFSYPIRDPSFSSLPISVRLTLGGVGKARRAPPTNGGERNIRGKLAYFYQYLWSCAGVPKPSISPEQQRPPPSLSPPPRVSTAKYMYHTYVCINVRV